MLGPNESQPLRFRVSTDTAVDFFDQHTHKKNASALTKGPKHATADDFRQMRTRTLGDMGTLGGVDMDMDFEDLAVRMSADASASEGQNAPAMSSDILRVGSVQSLLPPEPLKKKNSESFDADHEGGDGCENGSDNDAGSARDEGDDPPVRKPYFDRDRQVQSAKRTANLSLDALKKNLERTSTSVKKTLESMDAAEAAEFVNERKLLEERAKGIAAFFTSATELNNYIRLFDYHVGSGVKSKTPPCRNYADLKCWQALQEVVSKYDECSTKEELSNVSKDLAVMKRPITALQASIQSTSTELAKACESRRKRLENDKKKRTGSELTESEKKRKRKPTDIFEYLAEVLLCHDCATHRDMS